MNILAIGDPHFKVDNHEESLHFIHQVEVYIQNIKSSLHSIIILGDILHSHEKIYTIAMNTAVHFIKMCAQYAPTYCLVGNHDATSNTIFCSSNHWLTVLHGQNNVTVIEKPTFITPSIICCPYVSDGRFIESLDQFTPDWINAKCIFAHQLFDGVKMGAIIAQDVEEWNPDWPFIVSGHIHDRQRPQPNLYYSGSSQQLAFNENSDKSIALITVDNTVKIDEIYLQLKERKTIYATVAELSELKFKPNVQYKIVVQDEESTIKAYKKTAKFKELNNNPSVKSIQFKPRTEEQKEEEVFKDDFMSILAKRIEQEGNQYLQSYANSLICGTEDLSDKDVLLL